MGDDSNGFTLLIVHGAYFFANIWDDFRARLNQAGIESVCPQLPTCGDKGSEKAGQPEDIAVIQSAARDLIAKGRRIVVLAHSYGGIVACGALTDDLFANDERGPGVGHVIFLSAWVLQPGDTLVGIIQKNGSQSKVDLGFTADGMAYGKNTAESFFNDVNEVDKSRAGELAAATTTHNWVANALPGQGAPYKSVPSTYVLCLRDLAIMLPLQKVMVNDVVQAGASFDVREIDAGHCPFLSRPEEVLQIIANVK